MVSGWGYSVPGWAYGSAGWTSGPNTPAPGTTFSLGEECDSATVGIGNVRAIHETSCTLKCADGTWTGDVNDPSGERATSTCDSYKNAVTVTLPTCTASTCTNGYGSGSGSASTDCVACHTGYHKSGPNVCSVNVCPCSGNGDAVTYEPNDAGTGYESVFSQSQLCTLWHTSHLPRISFPTVTSSTLSSSREHLLHFFWRLHGRCSQCSHRVERST